MFKKFIKDLAKLGQRPDSGFDPATLEDPIATKTEWSPAKSGGASFCTHTLQMLTPDSCAFKISVGALFFYMVFLLVGLGCFGAWLYMLLTGQTQEENQWVLGLVGFIFSLVGGGMYHFGARPRIFDKRAGYYSVGKINLRKMTHKKPRSKNLTPLNEIHAIQLTSEHVRGDKSSYYSYELNLILSDAKRINVVDHGKLSQLRADAHTLADLLGVPVWDAT